MLVNNQALTLANALQDLIEALMEGYFAMEGDVKIDHPSPVVPADDITHIGAFTFQCCRAAEFDAAACRRQSQVAGDAALADGRPEDARCAHR